jgi:hypothetical protein
MNTKCHTFLIHLCCRSNHNHTLQVNAQANMDYDEPDKKYESPNPSPKSKKGKKRRQPKKQRTSNGSDAEIDLLDEPTPDEHLTAAKRGAYAEHLGCEPTSVAVVESLHERMKWTTKVACRSLLTLANSLGCDISAKVRAAFLV